MRNFKGIYKNKDFKEELNGFCWDFIMDFKGGF